MTLPAAAYLERSGVALTPFDRAGLKVEAPNHLVLALAGCAEPPEQEIQAAAAAVETAREVVTTISGVVTTISSDSDASKHSSEKGQMYFYVTDSPEKFAQVGGRFLGSDISNIEQVQLEACK